MPSQGKGHLPASPSEICVVLDQGNKRKVKLGGGTRVSERSLSFVVRPTWPRLKHRGAFWRVQPPGCGSGSRPAGRPAGGTELRLPERGSSATGPVEVSRT